MIIASRNAYVDSIIESSKIKKGTLIFELNTFDLEREAFKIDKDEALADLTLRRLTSPWLEELIIKPLEAGIKYAAQDVRVFKRMLQGIISRYDVGELTKTDVAAGEAQVAEKRAIRERAKIDLLQRVIEVDGQVRRLQAEKRDLHERRGLNSRLREMSRYEMPFDGRVEILSYKGAFVEEGDMICRVTRY